MRRTMMKSKIHRARVTEANLNYVGSITVDRALMREADLLPHEKVQVVDITNGARLETYIIPGPSGVICLNGAAARLVQPDDRVIIISYAEMDDAEAQAWTPTVLFVNEDNEIVGRGTELHAFRDDEIAADQATAH